MKFTEWTTVGSIESIGAWSVVYMLYVSCTLYLLPAACHKDIPNGSTAKAVYSVPGVKHCRHWDPSPQKTLIQRCGVEKFT